ncbi:MAG: hypothetical protein Crog4KO_07930 [Crocinitomicaceae bacterium]
MAILMLLLWLFKYEVVSPPALPQNLEAAKLDQQTIENVSISGAMSNAQKNPSSQQFITNKDSQSTVNTNSESDSRPDENVINPFNGTDGNPDSKKGTVIGIDNTDGNNSTVPGGRGNRSVISHVNANHISYNYNAKFVFQIGVNSQGIPVNVHVIKSLTTTSDELMIRKVTAMVKEQVRYSKSTTEGIQTVRYTVNFKAS